MCNFFSLILTREKQILWFIGTNSHDDILKANGIKDEKIEDRDFVRIEIVPNKKTEWQYVIDEEKTLPNWYVEKRENLEKMVMDFFNAHIKPHTIIKNRLANISAMTVYAYEGSTVYADDGSIVHADDGSIVHAYEGSRVNAYEGSTVYAHDGSIVVADKGSRVNAYDGSIVHAYEGSTVHAYEGSTIIQD